MYELAQFFSISMYWLWFYDYFLTLGDEVRYSYILRSKRQVLTVLQIQYAWSGEKSWSEFISALPKYPTAHDRPTVFVLFIAVRRPKKTSSCDALDDIAEQVHPRVAHTLQTPRHV
jgi:hypothetical protein